MVKSSQQKYNFNKDWRECNKSKVAKTKQTIFTIAVKLAAFWTIWGVVTYRRVMFNWLAWQAKKILSLQRKLLASARVGAMWVLCGVVRVLYWVVWMLCGVVRRRLNIQSRTLRWQLTLSLEMLSSYGENSFPLVTHNLESSEALYNLFWEILDREKFCPLTDRHIFDN